MRSFEPKLKAALLYFLTVWKLPRSKGCSVTRTGRSLNQADSRRRQQLQQPTQLLLHYNFLKTYAWSFRVHFHMAAAAAALFRGKGCLLRVSVVLQHMLVLRMK
jgi:hypothetical protein